MSVHARSGTPAWPEKTGSDLKEPAQRLAGRPPGTGSQRVQYPVEKPYRASQLMAVPEPAG